MVLGLLLFSLLHPHSSLNAFSLIIGHSQMIAEFIFLAITSPKLQTYTSLSAWPIQTQISKTKFRIFPTSCPTDMFLAYGRTRT